MSTSGSIRISVMLSRALSRTKWMRYFCLHQANPSCLHSQIVDFHLNLVDVNPPGNVIEFLACGLGVLPVLDSAVETNTDEGKDLFVRPDGKPMVFHMKACHEKDRVRKDRFPLLYFFFLSLHLCQLTK